MEFVIKFYQKVLEFFRGIFAPKPAPVEVVEEEKSDKIVLEFEYRKSKPGCASHRFCKKVMGDIVDSIYEPIEKMKMRKTMDYIYTEMISKYGNKSLKKGVFHIAYALQRAHELINELKKVGIWVDSTYIYLAIAAHDMDKNFTGKKYKHGEGSAIYIDSISDELLHLGIVSHSDKIDVVKRMVLNHSVCDTIECGLNEEIVYDADKLSRFPIEIGIKAQYEKLSKKNDDNDATIEKLYFWMRKKYGKNGEVKFKLKKILPAFYASYLNTLPNLDNEEETIKFIKEAILK